MKLKKIIEVEVSKIKVVLPIRYDDEDIPFDFPLRNDDTWTAVIDVNTGKIENWVQGVSGTVEMKVCDEGCYYLLDSGGNEIASIIEDYVPDVIPGSYGDYVNLIIDETGVITNWDKYAGLAEFEDANTSN